MLLLYCFDVLLPSRNWTLYGIAAPLREEKLIVKGFLEVKEIPGAIEIETAHLRCHWVGLDPHREGNESQAQPATGLI